MPAGVYVANKKDGTEYYRVSVTFRNKHISLGSFSDIAKASLVYSEALSILSDKASHFVQPELHTTSYTSALNIPFGKFISLINFRDNGIYIKTPIYLCHKYFLYFLDERRTLIFNTDDLFYYSNHTIMSRGGYYFVNDYGSQTSILSRYGIRAHAVCGRDYIFVNGDSSDYRYENIQVINRYLGVAKVCKNGLTRYKAYIHINGNYVLGYYPQEITAAIAYNKAVDMLSSLTTTNYDKNFIEGLSMVSHASIYNTLRLSKRFRDYVDSLKTQD